jgi:hypothetical protein
MKADEFLFICILERLFESACASHYEAMTHTKVLIHIEKVTRN